MLVFNRIFIFLTKFRLSISKDAPHNITSDSRFNASQQPGRPEEAVSRVQHARLRRPLVGAVRDGPLLVGGDVRRVVPGRVQIDQPELLDGVLREAGRGEGRDQQGVDQVLRRELVQRHRRKVAHGEGLGQEFG